MDTSKTTLIEHKIRINADITLVEDNGKYSIITKYNGNTIPLIEGIGINPLIGRSNKIIDGFIRNIMTNSINNEQKKFIKLIKDSIDANWDEIQQRQNKRRKS